ncbi:poly [ADP-ribose] polymerase 12-like [Pelobates cultripes]|uniref:Poly [ADP-ribose] polymerase n=2 Tax=Pelobates cultripes TaxID=61616 RepID=A0AAD1RTW8_PELCU|nr:poly [ADP-ribose] polymerase 12-like [Pelobates cultripes]
MFTKTLSGFVVKKIGRIQNPSLWKLYQWKKGQMKKANNGAEVDEKRLFRGTDNTYITHTCHENLDWRTCGTHGTLYGQGSYFSRDASYSHNYSPKNSDGKRTMFVARVLIGDYITGNVNLRRPPSKSGSMTHFYDSCVDNIYQPTIYVVFEKQQIYPEYLIEYEEEEKKSCCIS